MAYVDYEYYKSLYGDSAIPEVDFNRIVFDACRKIDIMTTGIDNVKKLKVAFPVDEDDAETVKRCVTTLLNLMHRVEQAEEAVLKSTGYIAREDGSFQGKIISSVSAGSESINYSVGNDDEINKLLFNKDEQEKKYSGIILSSFSGVTDANGVNLLYMGRYPYRVR